jgi:hypothetical protein
MARILKVTSRTRFRFFYSCLDHAWYAHFKRAAPCFARHRKPRHTFLQDLARTGLQPWLSRPVLRAKDMPRLNLCNHVLASCTDRRPITRLEGIRPTLPSRYVYTRQSHGVDQFQWTKVRIAHISIIVKHLVVTSSLFTLFHSTYIHSHRICANHTDCP